MSVCNPTYGDVFLAAVAVLAGCLVVATSVYMARANRNWIHLITAAGGMIFTLGIVGQRGYPSNPDTTAMLLACGASTTATPGPWHASTVLPLIGVAVAPVTMAGIVITVLGICGVLLFEPASPPAPGPLKGGARLEDGDSV